MARLNDDEVLDTLRKRAAVIGFRCGVVYHLLETEGARNRTESRSCTDFAMLMADYALYCQTELFAAQLKDIHKSAPVRVASKNRTLFNELPDEFDSDMLKALKPDSTPGSIRFMVYNWRRNGLIVPNGKHSYRKTSDGVQNN